MSRWYAAKVWGRETRASFYLERRGIRAFWPRVHRYSIHKQTKREYYRETALIPGYVFVAVNSPAERGAVTGAIGVAYLLGGWTDGQFYPREMPSQWVTALMDAGPVIVGKRVEYRAGQKVKRAFGALSEIIAEVEAQNGRKVKIAFDLFGARQSAWVDVGSVEMAD